MFSFRKYVIVNDTTANLCFDGRRFWTSQGAYRFAMRNLYIKINGKRVPISGEYSIHKIV